MRSAREALASGQVKRTRDEKGAKMRRSLARLPGRRSLVLPLSVAFVLLAALGAAQASESRHTTGTAEPNIAGAKALVDQFKKLPEWLAPGPPFDASKARGKTI